MIQRSGNGLFAIMKNMASARAERLLPSVGFTRIPAVLLRNGVVELRTLCANSSGKRLRRSSQGNALSRSAVKSAGSVPRGAQPE